MRGTRYRYLDHNGREEGVSPAQVQRVYGALRDRLDASGDGFMFVKSADLDLVLTDDVIGRCISALADCCSCPLRIERWSGEQRHGVWRIESGDRDE